MSISEFHASTILEVGASFGYSNCSCDPDEITSHLGIKPDEIRVQGTPRTTKAGITITTPLNSWYISSTSESKDINEHIRNLLLRLEGRNALPLPDWGEPSFGILWKGDYLYAGSGPFYEPDVMAGIASYGATLYQDIYQVDQEH